jgi:ankyrin repeat protein
MGSYFSHDHTESCCPPSGKWCTKLNDWGQSSMHYALCNHYSEAECLRALSNPQHICMSAETKGSLIRYVVHFPYTQLIQALIDCGIDINMATLGGTTALHIAVMYHPIQAKLLIDNGADVNKTNLMRQTPLYYAATHYKRNACIMLLDEGATIGIRHINHMNVTHSILVAYGYPFNEIAPNSLPQYLADSADAAFSRRKAAIRWWFWVRAQ